MLNRKDLTGRTNYVLHFYGNSIHLLLSFRLILSSSSASMESISLETQDLSEFLIKIPTNTCVPSYTHQPVERCIPKLGSHLSLLGEINVQKHAQMVLPWLSLLSDHRFPHCFTQLSFQKQEEYRYTSSFT